MNLWNEYAEGESSKWQVQQKIKICSPFLIGHNLDDVTVFMVWRQLKGAIARWRVSADMSRRERTIAGERERM